ncbi:MAG TPA: hypothetical protein PLV68_14350, partial [Ilumatobacteraceae bacterium]|nr:hypothetical protein [Ilumatobacteraceae bacterium]
MTLRLRLVAGLLVLLTIGLATFGVSTYAVYSRTEHDRLDDQIRNSMPVLAESLFAQVGMTPGFGPSRSVAAPAGSYAQLVAPNGTVLVDATVSLGGQGASSDRPALPTQLLGNGETTRFFTVGSSVGSGDWRVAARRFHVINSDQPF